MQSSNRTYRPILGSRTKYPVLSIEFCPSSWSDLLYVATTAANKGAFGRGELAISTWDQTHLLGSDCGLLDISCSFENPGLVVVGSSNGDVRIYSIDSSQSASLVKRIPEYDDQVVSVSWTGDTILSASSDGCATARCDRRFDTDFWSFAWDGVGARALNHAMAAESSQANLFALANSNSFVPVLDMRQSPSCMCMKLLHGAETFCVDWSGPQTVVTGGRNGQVKVWDIRLPGEPAVSLESKQAVRQVSVLPRHNLTSNPVIATCGSDTSATVWHAEKVTNADRWIPARLLDGDVVQHEGYVTTTAWSSSGDILATGSLDHQIILYSTNLTRMPRERL